MDKQEQLDQRAKLSGRDIAQIGKHGLYLLLTR